MTHGQVIRSQKIEQAEEGSRVSKESSLRRANKMLSKAWVLPCERGEGGALLVLGPQRRLVRDLKVKVA